MRVLLTAFVIVVAAATPAFAHTAFDPDEAAPGSVVTVTLNAADERDAANIVKVELYPPDAVAVAFADPVAATAGWTGTVLADHVEWTGPAGDGDQRFTITLGPLPDEQTRLQFKVLETYDNGEIDRWIEDAPVGGPEPEMPGPVLDLVVGAAGEVPPVTVVPETAPEPPAETATTLEVTPLESSSGEAAESEAAAEEEDDDDDSSNLPILIAVVMIGAAAIGGGIYLIRRR